MKTNQTHPKNPRLETLDCIDARMVELDLLEQALNAGRDLSAYKLQRLEDLQKRRNAILANQTPDSTSDAIKILSKLLGAHGVHTAILSKPQDDFKIFNGDVFDYRQRDFEVKVKNSCTCGAWAVTDVPHRAGCKWSEQQIREE